MSWITELIEAIPEIVIYIAPGFLFVNAFMWVSHRKFSTPTVQVVSSIVASFLLKTCFDWLAGLAPLVINPILSIILLCAISGILGIVLGIITGTPQFANILIHCHIYRSGNTSMWDDILNGDTWAAIYDDERGLYYCGQVRHATEDEKYLLIALSSYYIIDKSQTVIEWHIEPNDCVVIDTSKYRIIQISQTDPFKKTEPA